jgi:hypothetical protein
VFTGQTHYAAIRRAKLADPGIKNWSTAHFLDATRCARLIISLEYKRPRWGTLIVDEVGKLLPSLFRKQIGRAEPHLLEILIPLWPRIAGSIIAQHSQPSLFASGVLTLHADSVTWGTQLRYMAEEIRTEINGFLGRPIVKKLRIKTAPQSDLFSSPRCSRKAAPPATPLAEKPIDTDSIADPEIASELLRSYAKYFNRFRS